MNTNEPSAPHCQRCGAALAADAAEGLCPRCLLALNLGPQTQLTGEEATGRQPAEPPAIAELAPLFPQLEILELLGRGGMGAVYRARQKQLDRIVALKILPPGVGSDAAFAARFATEARALAKLNHPNIVTLYELGSVAGVGDPGRPASPMPATDMTYFFLMEFVDGMNLRQLMAAGRLVPREALAIVPQICDALQYAHDAGIVHRDIKPENILLDRRGRVKVADFGLAKLVGQADAGLSDGAASSIGNRQSTLGNVIMGTPQYMAPEQREHPTDVDHRADIFSLGVVFYQMLTGELPQGDFAAPSKRVLVDVRLDEVVLRALEKNPKLRYQQVSEVKTLVETILKPPAPAPAASAKRTFHELLGKLPDAAVLRRFFGIQDDAQAQAQGRLYLLSVDLLLLFLWLSLLYPAWLYPVVHGIEMARRKGRSPQWMWFALHPVLGWVAYGCLAVASAKTPPGGPPQTGKSGPAGVQTVEAPAVAGRGAAGRFVYVVFALMYLALVAVVLGTAAWLPDRVASHFGFAGAANGWMTRTGYLVFTAAFPLLLALFFAGISALIKVLPARFCNIPNRDYWLAPERRAATSVLIRHWLAGLLCLMTLLFAGLHVLTIVANRSTPPQLPMGGLLLLVIVFLLALMIWLTMFLMRFAEIGAAGKTATTAPSPSLGEKDAPDLRRAQAKEAGPRVGGWWRLAMSVLWQGAAALPLLSFAMFIVPKFDTLARMNKLMLPGLSGLVVRVSNFVNGHYWVDYACLLATILIGWALWRSGGAQRLRRWTTSVVAILFTLFVVWVAAVIIPVLCSAPRLFQSAPTATASVPTAVPAPAAAVMPAAGTGVIEAGPSNWFMWLLLGLAVVVVVIVALMLRVGRKRARSPDVPPPVPSLGKDKAPALPLDSARDRPFDAVQGRHPLEMNVRAKRYGKLALTLCLGGLLLPILLLALRLPPQTRLGALLWVGVFGITCLCEIAAIVLGILGWKSGTGKAAVIVAAVLPFLVVPGCLAGYWVLGRAATVREQVGEERNRAYLAEVEAVLHKETTRRLGAYSVRCDHIKVIVSPAFDSATILLTNPQELRGVGGSNVWTNIDGLLTARPKGDGYWEVRGDQQLGHVRFTVVVQTIDRTVLRADDTRAATPPAVVPSAAPAPVSFASKTPWIFLLMPFSPAVIIALFYLAPWVFGLLFKRTPSAYRPPPPGFSPASPLVLGTSIPRVLNVGNCCLSTPERLAMWAEQLFFYRNKGQLILDDRQLTFSGAGLHTVIGLGAIRDLSIGRLPRVMHPAALHFISVTYAEGGQSKRVILWPYEGLFGTPAQFNQLVAHWFDAIRSAIVAATGRAPASTPAAQLGTPTSLGLIATGIILMTAIGIVPCLLLARLSPPHRPPPLAVPAAAPAPPRVPSMLTPSQSAPGVRSWFPKAAHIGRKEGSVIVHHDEVDLYYVFYYAGLVNSHNGDTYNPRTHAWLDTGSIELNNGRKFLYLRLQEAPELLRVNGEEFNLEQGRVIVLRVDGTAGQLKLFPPLAVAQEPKELASLIATATKTASAPVAQRHER